MAPRRSPPPTDVDIALTHLLDSQWFYETTGPGSGLPVLSTLRDIIQSGDRVKSVEGCFSGTFAYLMDEARKGTPLSAALRSASKLGYLEPDPRNDLTGSDVRRKTGILARELQASGTPISPMSRAYLAHASLTSRVHLAA